MAIRIVLVDDHSVLLEGLEQLLRLASDFTIVAKCKTIAEARRAIETLEPDIVILDLKLRGENGLDLCRSLAGRTSPAVIVLTASEDEDELLEAVRCDVRGVVQKAMASTVLEQCIRTVSAGRTWLTLDDTDLGQRLAQRARIEGSLAELLTGRELEILRELATDRDTDAIARRLKLTNGTVRLHVHHVYQKLGVKNRHELWQYLKRRKY